VSARDTQFTGFAKLLLEELKPYQTMLLLALQSNDKREREWAENMIQTITARRAYDLTVHILSNTEHINLDRLTEEEHAARIPDMFEWPE
jgi:hypothetical protein